jgi:hypothetical protein
MLQKMNMQYWPTNRSGHPPPSDRYAQHAVDCDVEQCCGLIIAKAGNNAQQKCSQGSEWHMDFISMLGQQQRDKSKVEKTPQDAQVEIHALFDGCDSSLLHSMVQCRWVLQTTFRHLGMARLLHWQSTTLPGVLNPLCTLPMGRSCLHQRCVSTDGGRAGAQSTPP